MTVGSVSSTVLVWGEAERKKDHKSCSDASSVSEFGSEREDKAYLLGYFLMVP